jgi:hypothetical protein
VRLPLEGFSLTLAKLIRSLQTIRMDKGSEFDLSRENNLLSGK